MPLNINIDRRREIPGFEALEQLALDFASGWLSNHGVDKIWEELDPELWELLRNPWVVLQTISREKLEAKLSEPKFSKLLKTLLESIRSSQAAPSWFEQKYSGSALKTVAYFSMEYMLGESLPIYSGGLGNVAGDQLKAASDLGVPVIGIGMLYQQGYFRQVIDKEGGQHALYPYNDPGQLPITPLRKPNGEWLRLEIALPGWSVWLRAWEVKVGRVRLFLLDSNDAVNYPGHRGIISELYGGDSELRIKQEILLGLGGWRLLEALGIQPQVCHLNEGHAAFAILDRAKSFMKENKVPFEVALAATRAGNLFTTHTAVPAGFDRFHPGLIEQYLGHYAQSDLGISMGDLLALGRSNPLDSTEDFNMAYLAMRGSGAINAVSKLHGKVSRRIFTPVYPRWPEEEVPVHHVTNGVHMPTWGSVVAGDLWAEYAGKECWNGTAKNLKKESDKIPDSKIWQMRNEERKATIEYARARLAKIWEARGFEPEEIERARHLFDPNTLTLGFARRFATYKRSNLLLHDPERFFRILTNPQRPVQLLISGKAHPADKPGQAMLREWIQLFKRSEARSHVIFLTDYDMLVTQNLVRGIDVWLNTPRRPWEASGTSGMKVLVNGGINLSELDGWWAEAYTPKVGWAIGDGQEHGDDPAWDAYEANCIYDLLENQVTKEFYTRDSSGIPTAWVARIRESMGSLTPQYSADRTVRQYTEQHYLPAAENYKKRSANHAKLAADIVSWKRTLQDNWSAVRFGQMKVETAGNQHVFEVQIYLNGINPAQVKVELFAAGVPSIEMKRSRELSNNAYAYTASVHNSRPASDYTARIVPYFEGANVPLEASQILWQK